MRSALVLSLGLLGALPSVASAQLLGVPAPSQCTLPACMALCPLGDLPFTVVVRDLASNPIGNSQVALDFSLCPGAHLCPPSPLDEYVVEPATRRLRAATGPDGVVTFLARVGGVGGPGSVRVFADGIHLGDFALASPDQNGDGVVWSYPGVADDLLFAAKVGTTDPTADFDCDGQVDGDDQVVFGNHLSQSCEGWFDPVRPSSWGALKLHHR